MGRGTILTAFRRVGVSACGRVGVSARSARSKIFIVSARKITISFVGARTNRDSIGADGKAHNRYTPARSRVRGTHTPIRPHAHTPTRSQAGVSLVEMSIALVLFTTVAVFGFQTIMAGWTLQNSAIMQSMTDAYAGIETAYAQRWTFANISTSGRWPVYPASTTANVTIGTTPKGPVNATVVRTCHQYTDPLTGTQSYMLESYVVYQDKLRQYCKLSKVYRSQ